MYRLRGRAGVMWHSTVVVTSTAGSHVNTLTLEYVLAEQEWAAATLVLTLAVRRLRRSVAARQESVPAHTLVRRHALEGLSAPGRHARRSG
ncbi:hypothetical protein ACFXJ8_41040 [Nonomuraea sp. NPDC059194]|uniref:hypothetical protein n=1 Tax=Nonomuraea sp. NPDC059194 TaxID=3346764 RepID=UPI0036A9B6E8